MEKHKRPVTWVTHNNIITYTNSNSNISTLAEELSLDVDLPLDLHPHQSFVYFGMQQWRPLKLCHEITFQLW